MIFKVLARARRRLLWNAILCEGARAVSGGLGALILLLVLGTNILEWRWIWVVTSITFAAGACAAIRRRPDAYEVAQRIDSRLGLADTLSTAVFFCPPSLPRRCDDGMRLGQRERAMKAAAGVDLCLAFPLRIPRSFFESALVLALLAAGLLTVRHHFEGRLDLRAPVSPAILQLLREAKTQMAKVQEKLETPAADKAEVDRARVDNKADENAEGNAPTAESPAKAESGAAGEEKGKKQNPPETGSDRADAENRERDAEAEQEGGGQNPSANRDGNSQQRGNKGSDQQAADQPGSSSSVLSKVSDTIANLLSALKPQPGGNQARDTDGSPSGAPRDQKREADARPGQGSQGSASRSAESGNPDEANGGMSATRQNSDSRGEQRPGSGAGDGDGSKKIRLAEQLDAMGKISVILGKRSTDLSGTASIDVTSGRQELKTAYEARKVEHSDVQAKADRDEIPLELHNYVTQYFREMRKAAPRPGHALKRTGSSTASPRK